MIFDAHWRCARVGHDVLGRSVPPVEAPMAYTSTQCRRCGERFLLWPLKMEYMRDYDGRIYHVMYPLPKGSTMGDMRP